MTINHAEGIDLTAIIEATAADAFRGSLERLGLPSSPGGWDAMPFDIKRTMLDPLLEYAEWMLPHLAPALKAKAWDEGFAEALNQMAGSASPASNPYKEKP